MSAPSSGVLLHAGATAAGGDSFFFRKKRTEEEKNRRRDGDIGRKSVCLGCGFKNWALKAAQLLETHREETRLASSLGNVRIMHHGRHESQYFHYFTRAGCSWTSKKHARKILLTFLPTFLVPLRRKECRSLFFCLAVDEYFSSLETVGKGATRKLGIQIVAVENCGKLKMKEGSKFLLLCEAFYFSVSSSESYFGCSGTSFA